MFNFWLSSAAATSSMVLPSALSWHAVVTRSPSPREASRLSTVIILRAGYSFLSLSAASAAFLYVADNADEKPI